MTARSRLGALLAIVALVGACGRKKPAPPPAPQVSADSIARAQARQDSISRAEAEAARISTERAREENIRAQQRSRTVNSTMTTPVYFELDEADLTPEAIGVLEAKLAVMQQNPAIRVRITGHTDSRGSDEYNLALGQRRAAEARRFLVDRGVATGRIEIATRGEEEPAVAEESESAWARNRRAEFLILAR